MLAVQTFFSLRKPSVHYLNAEQSRLPCVELQFWFIVHSYAALLSRGVSFASGCNGKNMVRAGIVVPVASHC